jgi:predicted dehydrogenase
MNEISRRQFLNRSKRMGAALAGGIAVSTWPRVSRATSANEKIVLAIIGVRGRGQALATGFAERKDCEVAYLADVDTSVLASRAETVGKTQGSAPKTVQDFRRVLDDKSIDAVAIATPDHWHALATVWACQAGKHVYVEKPISHSVWEGRQMVNAARRYDRVVQVGTQCRSAPYLMKAKQYLDSGKLGKIHMCRVYNQKEWRNLKAVPDSDAPSHLDWNMWNGPAQEATFNFNLWEHWNHFWRYSGGDIINDGIHQLDLARWLIGKDYPTSIYSVGGRYAEPGCFETPDTQVVTYEYPDLLMTFELTLYTPYMLKSDPVLRDSDMFPFWPQNATRIEIFGEKGVMFVGRHGGGWQAFARPQDRKPQVAAQEFGRFPDPAHKADFVDAIRNHRRPNADIEEGHRSTLLAHTANISLRLGGAKLLLDAKTERFTNNDDANGLLKRSYREPWVVPDQV